MVGPIAGHDEDGCVDVDEDVLDDRSEGMLAAMRVPCADDDECGIPGGVQQRFRRRPHGLARSQRGPRVQPLDESGRLLQRGCRRLHGRRNDPGERGMHDLQRLPAPCGLVGCRADDGIEQVIGLHPGDDT